MVTQETSTRAHTDAQGTFRIGDTRESESTLQLVLSGLSPLRPWRMHLRFGCWQPQQAQRDNKVDTALRVSFFGPPNGTPWKDCEFLWKLSKAIQLARGGGGLFCKMIRALNENPMWLCLKRPVPKWNPGKWKHGLPLLFNGTWVLHVHAVYQN